MDIMIENAETYGKDFVRLKLIEELAELQQALIKESIGESHNVEEEIAHVKWMIKQYQYLKQNHKEVDNHYRHTKYRAKQRLNL